MERIGRIVDTAVIVLAAGIGIGSIVLLAAADAVGGYLHFGWSDTAILLWDALLSALFFVQHSGMVRQRFRQRLARAIPPCYHGAVYAIASGIALLIAVVFWQRSGTRLWVLEGLPRSVAATCGLLAVVVFAVSAGALRSFDPLGIGPLWARVRGREHHPGPFLVRGPYRWVRHPLYSCVLVLFWTNPDVTLDRILFNVLWSGWIVAGAVLEERDLTREFGERYRRYQRAVPMLIPWRGPAARTQGDV